MLTTVLTALGSPDIDVRFVGGCVRDTVLGRPVTDIDIATPDLPETVMEKLAVAGLKSVPTGLSHGTVTAISEGRGFEITTLRKDTACDGRHADVEFTTDWVEDASRRDFTFNALSARPDGTLFDPFGGVADAREGRVCFVGDPRDRIKEDYLRILRYFRFLAHYGQGKPDEDVVGACRDLRAGLARLPIERIRDELVKVLGAPDPSPAVTAMAHADLLEEVLPELETHVPLSRLIEVEREVNLGDSEFMWRRRFVFLLSDTVTAIDALARRLRFSMVDSRAIEDLRAAAMGAHLAFRQPHRNRFFYSNRDQALCDAILVAWANDTEKSNRDWLDLFKEAAAWAPVPFPLGGSDVRAHGLAEGPKVGILLRQFEGEWVDGGFRETRDDLLVRLKALLSKKKSPTF